MGEAIMDNGTYHENDPMAQAHLRLILSEKLSVESELFSAETGVAPDLEKLTKVALESDSLGLLMATLEEVGLADSQSEIEQFQAEFDELAKRGEGTTSEEAARASQLRNHLAYRDYLQTSIRMAESHYQQNYLAPAAEGSTEKLMELYDKTDIYINSPLLSAFEALRHRELLHTNHTYKDNVNTADRLARILISDNPS